jgi:hypothetical protein
MAVADTRIKSDPVGAAFGLEGVDELGALLGGDMALL